MTDIVERLRAEPHRVSPGLVLAAGCVIAAVTWGDEE